MVLVDFRRGESSQTRFSTSKSKYSAFSNDKFTSKLYVKLLSGCYPLCLSLMGSLLKQNFVMSLVSTSLNSVGDVLS